MYDLDDPLSLSVEVEAEAAKIRRGWDEKERRDRSVVKESPWTPPEYVVHVNP